jgi:hypothetical protein
MGFELGPGLLRRAPRGWLRARAFALQHAVRSHHYGDGGAPEIETTMALRVRWRVEIEGREPYDVEEDRDAPAWAKAGQGIGSGNRWYKVRIRPQFGLMPKLGVPCYVNPSDPAELWIDWDAAYEEHLPAWEQEARVRREIAKRDGLYDQVWDRVTNPFAGRLKPGEAEIAERRIAEDPSRAKPVPPPENPEAVEFQRRMNELNRIHATGRKTLARVVSVQATSRTLSTVPLSLLTFEIEGRTVVFEHVYGPLHLRHYKVGREVDMWVDPENPDAICPGR